MLQMATKCVAGRITVSDGKMRRERENQHLPQLEMKTRKDDE